MKNIVRFFVAFLFLIALSVSVRAEPCAMAELKFASVVHYEGYAKALLTFRFGVPNLQVRISKADGSEWGTYRLPKGNPRLLLTALPPNELFAVFVEDECGQMQAAGWFETWPGMDNPEGIEVSEGLFRASELFVQQDDLSLPLFLKKMDEIPVLDRLWFLQQFLYGGQPFPTDYGRNYPPDDFWQTMPQAAEECNCQLLFYGSASPALMQQGLINPVMAETAGGLGNNATYSLSRKYAGAAMHVELITEGCRAGGQDYVFTYNAPMDEQNNEYSSGAYGLLEYHFMCVGKDKVKEDCACTRCVNVNASLSAKLNADVTLKTGCLSLGKDKWGYASAQTVYVLVRTSQKEGYQILAAGNDAVKKEAEIQLNTDFFLNLIDVVAHLAPLLDSFTLQVVDIDGLANALKNLIQEPVVHHQATPAQTYENQLFRMYDREICFNSNDPNRILLWVVGFVTGGGRRKWQSHAYVQTGFHLDGIVKANFENEACCSDQQVGHWLAKSLIDNQIYSTAQMQAHVIEDLALWPWDGWVPYDGLPGEYGYLTYSWGLCDSSGLANPDRDEMMGWWQDVLAGLETPHGGERTEMRAASESESLQGAVVSGVHITQPNLECPCRLEVVDLQGRIWHIEENVALEMPGRLAARLREQGVFPHTGIYVLRMVGAQGVRADKVFVTR